MVVDLPPGDLLSAKTHDRRRADRRPAKPVQLGGLPHLDW